MGTDTRYLISVLCDGEPSYFVVATANRAGAASATLAELLANGYADLAFDLYCEFLRKRFRPRLDDGLAGRAALSRSH
jgi:hypothetical protein